MSYGFLQRWRRDARSSVVMEEKVRCCDGRIARGWIVVDVLGGRVGAVAGAQADFLVVSRGWFRSDLYIPLEAIGDVENSRVELNEPLGGPASERWSIPPHKR